MTVRKIEGLLTVELITLGKCRQTKLHSGELLSGQKRGTATQTLALLDDCYYC